MQITECYMQKNRRRKWKSNVITVASERHAADAGGLPGREDRLYRKGMSIPTIVDQLNTAGVPAPRGGKWTSMTIQNMLKNERYIGDTMLQKYISLSHIRQSPSVTMTDCMP